MRSRTAPSSRNAGTAAPSSGSRLADRFRLYLPRAEHPDWDEERIIREAAHRLSHGAVRPPTLREHFQREEGPPAD